MDRQRHAGAARRHDDAGASLPEVLVTMAIMGIMMAIFTGAILQIYRTSNKTEALTTAQSELRIAFQRFDRQLRYATWIAKPGKVGAGTTWYVEFAGPGDTECRQLRFETRPSSTNGDGQGVLKLFEWTKGSPPPAGAPGQTIASQLLLPILGDDPFQLQRVGDAPYASPSAGAGSDFTTNYLRLRIHLKTQVAAGTAEVDTTFTALNTSEDTPATNACSEGRPTA